MEPASFRYHTQCQSATEVKTKQKHTPGPIPWLSCPILTFLISPRDFCFFSRNVSICSIDRLFKKSAFLFLCSEEAHPRQEKCNNHKSGICWNVL